MIQRVFAWIVSIFLISMLFYGCLTPNSSEAAFLYSDKVMHLTAYTAISFWHCLMYPGQRIWVFLACMALGASIELLQAYLGYRDASYLDQVANTLGSGIGCLIAKYSGFRLFQDEPAYN